MTDGQAERQRNVTTLARMLEDMESALSEFNRRGDELIDIQDCGDLDICFDTLRDISEDLRAACYELAHYIYICGGDPAPRRGRYRP